MSIRAPEPHRSWAAPLHREPALVDEPMVVGAQLHEVVKRGRATTSPVMDVVRMQETAVHAPGETAAIVAAAQRTPKRRRDGARTAADGYRLAVPLDDSDHARVAPEPPDGLGRQRRPALELRAFNDPILAERFGVYMHHQLPRVSTCWATGMDGAAVQARPGERGKRVRCPGAWILVSSVLLFEGPQGRE